MKKALAPILSALAGVAIALAIVMGSFWALGRLSDVTKSGLFGICGPYGDDWSIWLQVGLLIIGLVGSPLVAVFLGRRIHRRFAM
ncbi:MAG: hypothetical protein QOE68_228 [Thermoanaerobaculia bacterium]|jgi:hypothetical protein|nr:hypothetical protein [Thermoanaerobaculia bacterium]